MKKDTRVLQLGDVSIFVVSDGTFWLDGGTMFGIVPKVLWSRLAPPDEENRIELGLNCLLVRSPGNTTLIDAGIGRDYSPKMKKIYRLDDRTNLMIELHRLGVKPEDVTRVVLTHVHFDHCGWCTRNVGGRWVPTFPKARHVVQTIEWADAFHPNELTRGGYMSERVAPLKEHGLLDLVNGETDLGDGIVVIPTPAHARGHQSVKISAGGQTVFCPGDIIPTRHHVRLPYVMAYDRDPEGIVQLKSSILRDAIAQKWIIFFTHDAQVPLARVEANGKGNAEATALE